jgi:hypothetical protein
MAFMEFTECLREDTSDTSFVDLREIHARFLFLLKSFLSLSLYATLNRPSEHGELRGDGAKSARLVGGLLEGASSHCLQIVASYI